MAPKKGSAAKPSAKGANQLADGDHIVFTNKPNGGKTRSDQEQQGPPRPDTRKIIGGASWTGKLPVNLLSEHCQRERWNKPDYSMRRAAGGAYKSSVTLAKTDPKTRETTSVPAFELPQTHTGLAEQESALEARHFAATYALFRIASMKNIHMTLPPKYRDLWKGPFQELKEEDVKEKREWKYDADPFAAQAKRKDIQASMEKRKVEQEKKAAAAEKAGFETPQLHAQNDRIWSRAPKVELSQNLRAEVEAIVRRHTARTQQRLLSKGAHSSGLIGDLNKLGFRQSHVREAAEYCSAVQEAIEWLLIHVPEDDLPKWALPPGYSTGISLASGDIINDAKMQRLIRGGYSSDLCAQALKDNHGDEKSALEALQFGLAHHPSDQGVTGTEASLEVWAEELMALEAVYGDRYHSTNEDSCSVTLEPVSKHTVTLRFWKPSSGYPVSAVPLLIVDVPGLPAYIRLSATKQALNYAWESLLGEQMIFSLVEHIQTILAHVIDDPGLLVDLEMQAATFDLRILQLNDPLKSRRERPAPHRAGRMPIDSRSSGEILRTWKTRQNRPAQQKMNSSREMLPAWSKRGAIVDAVKSRRITLITGDTGSGKSTQSVQYVLDDAIQNSRGADVNILCTQPRRVAALALSDRVAEERCINEGDEVGYIIRGASKVSPTTKITFMTTGILLRRLQLSEDPAAALRGISHVFIDEVHERSLDTDFLLALLKSSLSKVPDLTVVLMSATVDPETFIKYFGGTAQVARVHIEGRTFPVDDYYLDDVLRMTGGVNAHQQDDGEGELDVGKAIQSLGMSINYNLIASLVEMIDMELGSDPGAILIFLPGTLEIDRCLRAINQLHSLYALPLHASLLPLEQKKVFPAAPKGRRKVICSTNVAETSVTISDIVAVIDTGRVKETAYDALSHMVRLQEVWASQAACKQRRGRAGRVQAGTCYKLFTRNVESSMRPQSDPEVKRVPLEQLCLSVRATSPDHDVTDFLGSMISPPDSSAVASALKTLHRVGALDSGTLTGLGACMAMIPADLRCAKLIIYGSLFGCLEACLTIAAILTTKSPFISPRDKRQEADEARRLFPRTDGDLLLDRAAFDEWKEQTTCMPFRHARAWAEARFLSQQTLRDIDSTRQQLVEALKEAALAPTTYGSKHGDATLNNNDSNSRLLRALIAGALTPNVVEIKLPDKKYIQSMSGAKELDPEAKTIKYFSETNTSEANARAFVHPSSVLFDAQSYTGGATYVSYFTKMATSKTFIRDLTPVNAYGVLLFGGKIEIDTTGSGLMVDGWIKMRGWARIGVLVSRLRKLLDAELSRRIDEREDARGMNKEVVDVVRRLVELNGQDA